MDRIIQKIFSDSEKAELLEYVTKKLPDCDRILVIIESRDLEAPKSSLFEYAQQGFKQTYEILGFLDFFYQTIQKDSTTTTEEGDP